MAVIQFRVTKSVLENTLKCLKQVSLSCVGKHALVITASDF